MNDLVPFAYAKLRFLFTLAKAAGSELTNNVALASHLDLDKSRLSQVFRKLTDEIPVRVPPEMLADIIAAFGSVGVKSRVAWYYYDLALFREEVSRANPDLVGYVALPADLVWRYDAPPLPFPRICEFSLDASRADNENPDDYRLAATLLFGTMEADYEPSDGSAPMTVAIAVTSATLAIDAGQYRVRPGSLPMERGGSEHLLRKAGGVEIIGPISMGVLEGDALDGRELAVISPSRTTDRPFSARILVSRRCFKVWDHDAPAESLAARDAVLNAIIYAQLERDTSSNAAILASVSLTHIETKTTEE